MKKLKQMTFSMPVRPAPMGPAASTILAGSMKPNTRHSTKPTRSQTIRVPMRFQPLSIRMIMMTGITSMIRVLA